jgi:hypothetical protein
MASQLIIPDGKATGCNPRITQYGECCKLLADEIEIIPRDKWGGLIGQVNLRPFVNQILDQNGYGSCATESTTQGVQIARAVAGAPFVLLNPLSIYRVTSGGSDRGSSIDENLQFARDHGILPESYWPRSKGWRAAPPADWKSVAANYRIDEFFDVGTVEELGTALLRGFPVVFGWQGHSVIATRLLSATMFEYANSWGDWGDEGFGTLSLDSVNWGYGAFAVKTTAHAAPDPDLPKGL